MISQKSTKAIKNYAFNRYCADNNEFLQTILEGLRSFGVEKKMQN